MAACLTYCFRGLAVLVRSYRGPSLLRESAA